MKCISFLRYITCCYVENVLLITPFIFDVCGQVFSNGCNIMFKIFIYSHSHCQFRYCVCVTVITDVLTWHRIRFRIVSGFLQRFVGWLLTDKILYILRHVHVDLKHQLPGIQWNSVFFEAYCCLQRQCFTELKALIKAIWYRYFELPWNWAAKCNRLYRLRIYLLNNCKSILV